MLEDEFNTRARGYFQNLTIAEDVGAFSVLFYNQVCSFIFIAIISF
jgi:hypothetical protein